MYCRKCGKTIPDDSAYCPYCSCAVELAESGAEGSPKGKAQKSSGNPVIKIALAAVVVIAVAVCGFLGIKALTSGNDAPVENIVSTVPPVTEPEATEPEVTEPEATEPEVPETAETKDPIQEELDSNPWVAYDSMEEAEEVLGFGLEFPEMAKEFELCRINVVQKHSNLWVIFRKEAFERDPNYYDKIISVSKMISIQKFPSYGTPYFDAEEYDTQLVNIDGRDVVLLLDNREVVEADWVADGFGYCVIFENCGLSAYTVIPVIAAIQ